MKIHTAHLQAITNQHTKNLVCIFKILDFYNVTDGPTDGRTDGRTDNIAATLPPLGRYCRLFSTRFDCRPKASFWRPKSENLQYSKKKMKFTAFLVQKLHLVDFL